MPPILGNTAYNAGGFNAYPSPTGGQGAFGKVPGQIGLPPSLYSQANAAVPGLTPNAAQASTDVQSLLQGQLAPDTEDYIKRLVAAKGVSTGVEGSQFNTADLIKSLGLTSEQLVTSGLGAYNSLLNTVGGLQENPALQAEIAQSNAMLGAAPDPAAVHQQMLEDLQNEFNLGQFNPAAGSGWGSTHILGPAPTFGGGGGVGSSPFSTGLSSNDIALVGGPTGTPTTPTANTWQDYLQRTLGGYGLGNPLPAGGAGTGLYDPTTLTGNNLYGDTDYTDVANMVQ